MGKIHGIPTDMDWAKAQAYGVRVYGVEDYCLIQGNYKRHILLGYGNLPEEFIEPGIARLTRFIEETVGASQQCSNKKRPKHFIALVLLWPYVYRSCISCL